MERDISMSTPENHAPNNNRERPTLVHSTFWKVMGVMVAATSLYGTFSLATMLVDRNPPIVFHERYAMNNDVPQGGILSVSLIEEHMRYCKSGDYRWVIDSEQTKHTITSFSVSKASPYAVGKFHEQRDVTIPLAASLGPARYYIEAYYYCNILQRILDWPIIVRSPDVRFNVIPFECCPTEHRFCRHQEYSRASYSSSNASLLV